MIGLDIVKNNKRKFINNYNLSLLSNIENVYKYLTNVHKLTPTQATALMGNIMLESSWNPSVKQINGDKALGLFQMHGDLLKAYQKYLLTTGKKDSLYSPLDYVVDMIKESKDSKGNLLAPHPYTTEYNRVYSLVKPYLGKSNLTPRLLNDVNYYYNTYGNRLRSGKLYLINDLQNAWNNPETSVKDLTKIFTNVFERSGNPEYDKRVGYALEYYDYYKPSYKVGGKLNKYLLGRNIEVSNDAILRKLVVPLEYILPIPKMTNSQRRDLFLQNNQTYLNSDNRERSERQRSHQQAEQAREVQRREQQKLKAEEGFDTFMRMISPSTYIGQAIGELLTGPAALAIDAISLGGAGALGRGLLSAVKVGSKLGKKALVSRAFNRAVNSPIFLKEEPITSKNLFRTQVYKGGEITDPHSNFITTDPLYATNYGKVTPYIFESKSVAKAKEPMMGYRDPVSLDMFIYNNTKGNPNATAIIGHDAVTGEFIPSKGIEILNMNPKNLYPIRTSNSPTSLKFFERPTLSNAQELAGATKWERNFKPKWHIANYPGYLLKGLMKGSLLEKQLSKNGTININLLNAYFNKASQLERDVANKVLAEKFAGLKTIDYNQFKKAVLEELIGKYNRVPLTKYADYGMDRLGLAWDRRLRYELLIKDKPEILQYWEYNPNTILFTVKTGPNKGLVADPELFYGNYFESILPGLSTFTFESPRIPYGNTKHYGGNPIGHSRTYTLPEDPHTLYVMESQSDWALLALRKKGSIDAQSAYERASLMATKHLQEIELMKANLEKGLAPDGHKIQYEWERRDIEEIIKLTEKQLASNNARAARFDAILHPEKYVLENYLKQNYLLRQLQENLRYAAENGLTKMRYPTRESAIKIEGYTPAKQPSLRELSDAVVQELKSSANAPTPYSLELFDLRQKLLKLTDLKEINRINSLINRIQKIEDRWKSGEITYPSDHETILDKYSDFPKLFLKLYKGLLVRTVTDAKGNTWYEVDVPRNYLNMEWLFKQGGKMNTIEFLKNGSGIHIKKKNRGKFTDYCGGKVTQECINRGKHSSNPITRKRATFADNARHFKHSLGGLIFKNFKKYFIGGTFEPIINTSNILSNLTQLPYNLDYLNNLQEIKKRLKLLKMLDEANRTNLILETIIGLASDYFKTKNSPAISFNAPTSSTFKLSSFWNNPTLLLQ